MHAFNYLVYEFGNGVIKSSILQFKIELKGLLQLTDGFLPIYVQVKTAVGLRTAPQCYRRSASATCI
jgi:hypothetical protein